MSGTLLRPHHALCVRFFEGKGYSGDFVRHMYDVIHELGDSDPEVTLTRSCDIICAACPHNAGGRCETEETVNALDNRALAAMGLSFGDTLSRSALYGLAESEIISRGRLKDVCRGCMWLSLCSGAEERITKQ